MVEPEVAYADARRRHRARPKGSSSRSIGRVLDERQRELKALERNTAKLEAVQAPVRAHHLRRRGEAAQGERACRSSGAATSAAPTRPRSPKPSIGPVAVTGYPSARSRRSTSSRTPTGPRSRCRCDFLAPEGYGEIIGGGQRLDDYDLLLAAHRRAQTAARGVRVVSRPAPLRQRAAQRLRHGHRARRVLDLRTRSPARGDPVPANAVQAVPVQLSTSLKAPRDRSEGAASFDEESLRSRGLRAICGQSSKTSVMCMKLGFVSLGCPKNLVDGEVMLGCARDAGHEITADARVGRRDRRQHLRVHRHGQGRVDRRDPRDGRAQARRHLQAAGRHRAAWPSGIAISSRPRSRKSTSCSAPAKCRKSSAR